MGINQNWDLDSVFPGGSGSAELKDFLAALQTDINQAEEAEQPGPLADETDTEWIKTFLHYEDLTARLRQASAFVGCLISQDVHDTPARLLSGRLEDMSAQLQTLWTHLNGLAAQQPDDLWNRLMQSAQLAPIAFALNEGRDEARQKMPPEMEALAGELASNGYHAWNQLYGTISGLKQVDFEPNGDGSVEKKSLGQLQNIFDGDPDRAKRQKAFESYEAAWEELAPTCAMALNYQAGFRLTMYKRRGWDSILHEPLLDNRISRQTLDTMWGVVADKSAKLLPYLNAKAKLLGLEKLKWYDTGAPVGQMSMQFDYESAVDFIENNIRTFNPDIADYCRMAVNKQWVEAENRSGKRAGAFCTGLPLIGESRIFMTFQGTYTSMSTLAHELGHGYHGWVMRDLPFGARRYTMSVAETASNFNELIVGDAALKMATDKGERLSLLNQKLDDALTHFMNIKCRYDFERAFFAKRAAGHLSVEDLSDLMLEAQKTAYHNGLAEDGYHSLFWASKLHFYITRAPFYNFPYTFGYLFSNGVYTQALSEGPSFKDRYIALLRDTGSMDTETLAKTHLGVDLTQPAFWEAAADRILGHVDEFVTLAENSAVNA